MGTLIHLLRTHVPFSFLPVVTGGMVAILHPERVEHPLKQPSGEQCLPGAGRELSIIPGSTTPRLDTAIDSSPTLAVDKTTNAAYSFSKA